MKSYKMESYDVLVVGAGHAGCEAALAAARLGKKTLILTISLEAVAMMPCNPSIGGTGKGQLVREIDALGGEMGLIIDKTFIQSRMLNRSKGPAVHSPRAQADKQRYHMEMKHRLEQQENLDLRQGEVVDLLISEGVIHGVLLKSGAVYPAKTVILATGTYLNGLIHVSASAYPSGPGGMSPSLELPERMRQYGFRLRRFKTGTPARVLATSLRYEALEEQKGDAEVLPFSFLNDDVGGNQKSCWLTYTNPEAHRIVAENIEKTAPYGGYTTGVGPRYCLSIEDKVSRFPERTRHQLFLEPEGMYTEEVYVQGMSTSLPEDIQIRFYRSIAGMENVKISRYAYSIEYDCLDPLSLKSSLEHREVANLFCAGQINGSSGYEEAAAQGLIAGINAARRLDGKEPYVPDRSEAYIGVLIDDLTTKGTEEPYRIMTSRAEFRLILRQDNADLRLTETGYRLGLASRKRYERYLKNKGDTEREIRRLEETFLSPEQGTAFLRGLEGEKLDATGTNPVKELKGRISLADLLKRPEVTCENMREIDRGRPDLSTCARTQAEIQIKYAGYIDKQKQQVEKFRKLEDKRIPADLDYGVLSGLRLEAMQKLGEQRPTSIGQASRISGVSPADINVLLIHLMRMGR
jgi:tRNA uridine 5-carboxymethylaminomethyl modification enzyme